jgi:hypothetical protein
VVVCVSFHLATVDFNSLIKVAYEPKLCYNINIGGISFNSYMF